MEKTNINLSIEKMTENQVVQVFEIERDLLGTSNIDVIKQTLNSETLNYYVLKKDNEIIGFLEISIISPECELYDIAIKKEFQGNHYSDVLMNFLIEKGKAEKVETIFLEVNSINNKAISLYKKFGFYAYTIRKNYYGKNDAILMKKDLWFWVFVFYEIFEIWKFK